MMCGKLKSLHCMVGEILDRFHCVFMALYLGDKGKHYLRAHKMGSSLYFVCVAIFASEFPEGLCPLDNTKHSNNDNGFYGLDCTFFVICSKKRKLSLL